jgi:hypothetical protein
MKNNNGRAKAAQIFFWIIIALNAVAIFMYAIRGYVYQSDEWLLENPELSNFDLVFSVLIVLESIAIITQIVLFIQWFRRAYYNLGLVYDGLEFTEGWAAGAWFVPFINLVRPYKIMGSIFEDTRIHLSQQGIDSFDDDDYSFIGWWWALYLIMNTFSNLENRYFEGMQLEAYSKHTIYIVGCLITISAAYLALHCIKKYQPLQEALHSLGEGEDEILAIGSDL